MITTPKSETEKEWDTRKPCNRRNQHPNTWREGKLWKTLS